MPTLCSHDTLDKPNVQTNHYAYVHQNGAIEATDGFVFYLTGSVLASGRT